MRKTSLLLFFAVATSLHAQLPEGKSVWLEWRDLRIAMAPQSIGTFLWVQKSGADSASRDLPTFYDNVNPADLSRWLGTAKKFVHEPIKPDTGSNRSSAILVSPKGGMYLVRRRVNGNWSPERFFILESQDGERIVVNMDEATMGEVLDSLEAVVHRTKYSPDAATRHTRELAAVPPNTVPPAALPDNPVPPYSRLDVVNRVEGTVLLSLVIDATGSPDITSVRVLHSPAPGLLGSVLSTLPEMKFTPAMANGTPIRMRIVLPFSFALAKK